MHLEEVSALVTRIDRLLEAEDGGVWRTINGARVFIADGETVKDVLARRAKHRVSHKKRKTDQDKAHTVAVEADKVAHTLTADVYHKRMAGFRYKDFIGRETTAGSGNSTTSFANHAHLVARAIASDKRPSKRVLLSNPYIKKFFVDKAGETMPETYPSGKKMTRKDKEAWTTHNGIAVRVRDYWLKVVGEHAKPE